MYKDYTYVVTGSTGYVGNVFVKKLLAEGCKVIGFARSEKKAERVFGADKPIMVYGDVTNKEDVARLFEGVDSNYVVIHTVAKVSIGEASAEELQSVTVDGTKNVVELCVKNKIRKLIHISSTEALPKGIDLKTGLTEYEPKPELTKKGYGRAKSKADQIVINAVKNDGLDASILMFASVLGPGDYGKSHMSQMFIDYIEGRLPASIKGGYNDFDIRDVADVLPAIIEKSNAGESYIFAHEPNTINDSLKVISDKLGTKKLVTLPIWLAYVGVPFLGLWAKLRKKRPLYTSAALSTLKEDANFPLDRVKEEFGYNPRPLSQTVSDHVDFMIKEGMVKI